MFAFRRGTAASIATLAFALAATSPAQADDQLPNKAASATITAPEIEYESWRLDNGLTVIAIPDPSTATVTTSLWYEVGAKHDPQGRSGFAHLFEHILSRKTENIPYNLINSLTADVGGTRNASTSDDRTNYYEIVPAEYLETMLWTHAERMARPVIDEEIFDSERDVVKEELRQRVLAQPYGRLISFVVPENAYDALPNRRPTIGSIADLDSAQLDDARAFHQAFYGPDTATLIIAGNFEAGNLRRLVDQYFADIPRRENPVPLAIAEREGRRTSPRLVQATAPNVPLPVVGSIWQTPPADDPAIPVLEVIDAILSTGENSRLHEALIRSGKAVQAIEYMNPAEEGGYFLSAAVLNPAADLDEVEGLLAAEIERLRTQPVTAAELTEAKNELLSGALRERETAQGRAFELGEALVRTGRASAADERLKAIAAVTATDIRRVAAQWLAPQSRVAVRYLQGEDNPASYANPAPMRTLRTLPPAVGEPLSVLPEGERMKPPAPGARPDVVAPEIVERTLPNGIRVVAAQTGDVPIATMTVLVPGGTVTDSRESAGVAEFAASLADKGTATRSAREIAAELESLGASLGASAGADGTYFSLTAPVATMEAAGEVLADILRHAAYPQDDLDRERKRAIDGLQVALNDPGSLAQLALSPIMYGAAPYGIQATPETLGRITSAQLVEHRKKWWHPAATQVIVSGGISPERAVALTQSLLGDWTEAGPPPAAPKERAGEAPGVQTVVIDLPNAGQAAVLAAVRTLPRSSDDYYSLLLANTVLGGGSSGRLFEEVRTKRALSYGAYSGLPSRSDDAVLTASAQTKNETADEVAKIILDEFARLGDEPFEDSLLGARRLYLSGNYARALESSSGFNAIVAGLLQQGLSPEEASLYAERLAQVSAQDATRVAAQLVRPERATLIVVGDSQYFLEDLRKLRPDLTVIPAARLDLATGGLLQEASAP